MATHKSAIKRIRQTVRRTAVNQHIKSGVRTAVRTAREATTKNDPLAAEAVAAAQRSLAKAATKHTIHWKAAARKSSRLAKALKTAKPATAKKK